MSTDRESKNNEMQRSSMIFLYNSLVKDEKDLYSKKISLDTLILFLCKSNKNPYEYVTNFRIFYK